MGGDTRECVGATMSKAGEGFATTRAEIYLDRFQQNIRRMKAYIGSNVELMAVVKADAYGHGAVTMSRVAFDAGADHVAVYTLAEAMRLRKAGVHGSIVVLGPVTPEAAGVCVSHSITTSIASIEYGRALSAAAAAGGIRAPYNVELDTGLTRYGILPDEAAPLVQALDKLPCLAAEGLFTHFAKADEAEKGSVWKQFHLFMKVRDKLASMGLRFRVSHVAASAATLDFPEMHLDLVRCGISLYGYYPSSYVKRSVELQPVMALGSDLARVRTVAKGCGVSYGHDWKASKRTAIGLVPFGYADGMPRNVQGKGHVLVRGRPAPIVGRVAMDQFMIDLSCVKEAREGDAVTIIGLSREDEITADDIGEWSGTISYDVLSGISPRVPRLYIAGGKPVAQRLGMTMEPGPIEAV